jgi:hypothetical protein
MRMLLAVVRVVGRPVAVAVSGTKFSAAAAPCQAGACTFLAANPFISRRFWQSVRASAKIFERGS